MKNYIHKIAKDNIKKNKKFYKHIFISMFFAFFMIMFSCILFYSLDKYDYEKRAYLHGKWDVIVEYIDNEDETILNNLRHYSKKGQFSIGGQVVSDNQNIGYIGYYDEIGLKLANLHLLEGRLPTNDHEVVVEKSALLSMNLTLDQSINLNYEVNDQIKTKIYKVVGVVEDYVYYWGTKGLSFITSEMESYEDIVMLKASSALLLWNEVEGSGLLDVTLNTFNYPNYEWFNGTYLNESPLLGYAIEMILFSFIAIMSSIMSSLDKRESQFVLFRSIGMTYKQLKKLIIYEGYILAFVAFVFAGIASVILSVIVMGLYAIMSQSAFVWHVSFIPLCIELSICIFVMMMGIFLPTLTVYNLPLTSKKGEYYYHSKKRKIRKPTIKNFAFNKLFNSKMYSASIFLILCFILFRGFMMVDATLNYHQNNNTTNKNYDYVWVGHGLEIDISPLFNDEDIHIIQSKCSNDIYYKWDDMDKESKTIQFRRGSHVHGRMVCVESDDEVISYLKDKGYDVINELGDYEAVVIIPNHNYAIPIRKSYNYNEYVVDPVRKKDGLYAADIGLTENRNIDVYAWIQDETYTSLKIDKAIRLEEESIRHYFDYYTVIVNEKTYQELSPYKHTNYYVIKTDNDIARSKVQKFFHSVTLPHGSWTLGRLTDVKMEQIQEADILKTGHTNEMIHSLMMNLIFIFLIYIMRILSVDKEKKLIHLLRNIGMTKKDIYIINMIYSSVIYIASLIAVFIVWVFWYKVMFDGFINIFAYLEKQILLYGVIVIITLIIYTLCMLLPIKNILKEQPLYFMK